MTPPGTAVVWTPFTCDGHSFEFAAVPTETKTRPGRVACTQGLPRSLRSHQLLVVRRPGDNPPRPREGLTSCARTFVHGDPSRNVLSHRPRSPNPQRRGAPRAHAGRPTQTHAARRARACRRSVAMYWRTPRAPRRRPVRRDGGATCSSALHVDGCDLTVYVEANHQQVVRRAMVQRVVEDRHATRASGTEADSLEDHPGEELLGCDRRCPRGGKEPFQRRLRKRGQMVLDCRNASSFRRCNRGVALRGPLHRAAQARGRMSLLRRDGPASRRRWSSSPARASGRKDRLCVPNAGLRGAPTRVRNTDAPRPRW
jgi:hypothetical protein